jgi:hypothetical protein
MKSIDTQHHRFLTLTGVLLILLIATLAHGQNFPQLFRQTPAPSAPGRHGVAAHIGDIDAGTLSAAPNGLVIALPGRADLSVEHRSHQRRGARDLVWRGAAAGNSRSKVTLTYHEGLLYGRIESDNEIYSIHTGANGRTTIERIDSDSFKPEWGHDHASHGHDRVPPASGAAPSQSGGSSGDTAQSTAAAEGTVEIVLLSVYTPQARTGAGGATNMHAQIQAAVDQANTAFINSQMTARFFLAHTAEVTYNDSGNMNTDLDWVTADAGVASLRNTHAADMVSLIVENGGAYCGIAWVQRNPGSGFASHAFQVTDRGCLPNSTFAHEHGHNMGMEHNPENSSVGNNPSAASYDFSFGHWISGSFATIMTYNSICPVYCPRILNFSNPDVLYSGLPTGILNQRDNAQTGDLTAPIIANYRLGGGSGPNEPPVFTSDPIVKSDATYGQAYSGSIAGDASDPNADPLSYSKTGGPAWLSVAANGTLSGTPAASDLGVNTFDVNVSDGRGGSDTAKLQITVIALLAVPTIISATPGVKQITLNWSYSGSGHAGFKIERSTNNKSYTQITTVPAGQTNYTNPGLRSGRKYYYRMRAYNGANNSGYSNIVSATAN